MSVPPQNGHGLKSISAGIVISLGGLHGRNILYSVAENTTH
jgi:hypothetical protein